MQQREEACRLSGRARAAHSHARSALTLARADGSAGGPAAAVAAAPSGTGASDEAEEGAVESAAETAAAAAESAGAEAAAEGAAPVESAAGAEAAVEGAAFAEAASPDEAAGAAADEEGAATAAGAPLVPMLVTLLSAGELSFDDFRLLEILSNRPVLAGAEAEAVDAVDVAGFAAVIPSFLRTNVRMSSSLPCTLPMSAVSFLTRLRLLTSLAV